MKSNIQHLRNLLTTDEQGEFLDAIENEIEDYKNDATNLKDVISSNENEIRSLESEIIELQESGDDLTKITTPLGTIEYRITGSMDLQIYMDQIAEELYNKYTQTVQKALL